jgi:pectin methylesterase-like acyl-CoA thioesterase
MKAKLALVMLSVVLIGMSATAVRIQSIKATTIIVPDNYPTIQEAVDAATNGDTVFVRSGEYDEDVVIDSKSISLIGEHASNTTIRGLGKGG